MEEILEEVKEKQPTTNEGLIYKGITIESSKGRRFQKVILDKPTVKMIRHIRTLYVKAHLNRKLVFNVLMDNISTINVLNVLGVNSFSIHVCISCIL